MALKMLKSHLDLVKPAIGYAEGQAHDLSGAERKRTEHWQVWYTYSRWRKLRWSVLTRDCFTCVKCGRTEADPSRLVCDHLRPHRGDPKAFWSGPFQTLCQPCHDAVKQAEEHASRIA